MRPIEMITGFAVGAFEYNKPDENGNFKVRTRNMSGAVNELNFKDENGLYDRFLNWTYGEGMVQDLLYDLNKDVREQLISGITPEEWEEMFGKEEYE